MGPIMELRTRQYRQNAQNFGPELLEHVLGPKSSNNKSKVCPNPDRGWGETRLGKKLWKITLRGKGGQ